MASFNRIFGKPKPKAKPGPSAEVRLQEAADHMDKRSEHLLSQIQKCDQDLDNWRKNRAAGRPSASDSQGKQLLSRKKMLERQYEQLSGTRFAVDQTQFMTEQLKTTALTAEAMQEASKSLKAQYKAMNVSDIERVQDDFADLAFDQEEIQEILGRNYGVPDGVDDAELEAEFANLKNEIAFDSAMGNAPAAVSYLPTLDPSVPSGLEQGAAEPIRNNDASVS